MAADESQPTDASTVHRQSDDHASDFTRDVPLEGPLNGPGQVMDAEALENAKTVIRDGPGRGGSLRAQPAADHIENFNRTPAAITRVLLGKKLNHFVLQELIGGGGMGAVFRAHDEQLDREVAIKVIPFAGDDAELQRRFRNEAKNAAKLDHPRIARVFDVGNQDDWYYIVFEYIQGTNIRDLVHRSDVLPIDDAVYYTCQVAEAIQHASQRGIVHRDIKPSNVLIDSDREVKLVDMGLARSDRMEMSQEDLTASGVTLGTFDYISPEQAKDPRAADLRSDIYSLGCTLYFMLTGEPPYPGGTMLQKLLSHGNAPPPDARHIRTSVSFELSAVIQKMLAKDPDARYQNANDLIADLRDVAFQNGLSRSQGVVAVSTRMNNPIVLWLEQHAPWMVPTTLLLLGAAWLQLSSTASRDSFRLNAPRSAQLAEADPLGADNAPSGPSADTNRSAISTTNDDSSLNRSSAASVTASNPNPFGQPGDPPSLNNLPQPSDIQTSDLQPTDFQSTESLDAASQATGKTTSSEALDNDSLDNDAMSSFQDSALLNSDSQQSPTADMNFDSNRFRSPDVAADLDDAIPAAPPRVIRVVKKEATIDSSGTTIRRGKDGAALTTSLTDSLQLAEQYDVDRIELAVTQIESEPIVIDRDGLSVVSTVGGTTIIFRTPEVLTVEPSEMISLGTNRTEFDDLHFVWDVSPSRVQRGALIGLGANRLVRLTDCSITIGNSIGSSDVVAFAVTTGRQWDTMAELADPSAARNRSLPLVGIQMYNVIVRGQISMIRMDDAAALQLQWENGLLAVSRRMIETYGARAKPSLTSSPIELSLTRLTSHTPLGLLQMKLDPQSPYPVTIDRNVTSCVFVVDEGAAHIEVTGLDSIEDQSAIFKTRGEANAYEVDRIMLSLVDRNEDVLQVSMRQLAASRPPWFGERSTRWTIWWKSDLHDDGERNHSGARSLTVVPPDQRTPADYQQDGAVFSGFDEKSLPQLPFETDNTQLDIPSEAGLTTQIP